MFKVSHRIQIGNDTWASAENSRLVSLFAEASLHIPVNQCRFSLTYPDGISATIGDEVVVELGQAEELEKVFTGTISQVHWTFKQVHITASSSFQHLLAQRINSYFEKPSAADIVKELAQDAGVEIGQVETGLTFDFYTIGDQHSGYEQLRYLADQCGVDLYADEEDKLIFTQPSFLLPYEFQFGVNVLDLTISKAESAISRVEILGESPASHGQGADATSWLTKTDVSGAEGTTSGLTKFMFDPTARSNENAGSIASNRLASIQALHAGRIRTLGRPEVRLGEEVKLSQMPVSEQEGSYKIVGIQHRIGPRKGFQTLLSIAQKRSSHLI
ncbi:MAG: hypothetical protein AAF388_00055 [Bacteroidota bacterium]